MQPRPWHVVAVALLGAVLATLFVGGMIDAADPRCCPGEHPYVTIYDRERSQIEALLVTGDGQAFAALAQDPLLAHPEFIQSEGEYSYRAQRPVWGYLAWMTSLGRATFTGWALVGLTILSCGLACGAAARLLAERGGSPWWALLVIIPAQETLSTLTPELLAFALLAVGVLLWERGGRAPAVMLLCLAVLTRESIVIAVVALALWELWERRAAPGSAARRVLPLALPCLAYATWATALRVRLGSWPVGSSETRLTFPGVGLFESLGPTAARGLVVGVVLGVALCVSALVLAPHDPLTWITVAFAAFATTLSSEVWSGDGFTRTLIPMYAFGAIATIGALHHRRELSSRPESPRRAPMRRTDLRSLQPRCTEPSRSSTQPGLCATSQGCPSGSMNTPE